jgi:hypothetical protein
MGYRDGSLALLISRTSLGFHPDPKLRQRAIWEDRCKLLLRFKVSHNLHVLIRGLVLPNGFDPSFPP